MVEQIDLFEASKEEELDLDDNQKALLDLITYNTYVLNRKTTQKEVCEVISGYVWNDNVKSHDHCSKIWHDIEVINNRQDKIIINNNFEYKVAETKEEVSEYLEKKWKDLEPRLSRYWKLLKKVNTDGQYDIFKEKFKEVFRG